MRVINSRWINRPNPEQAIADYMAAGLTHAQALDQYQIFLEAAAPKPNLVAVYVSDEMLARLNAEAERRNVSVGEVVRGRLRLADQARRQQEAALQQTIARSERARASWAVRKAKAQP